MQKAIRLAKVHFVAGKGGVGKTLVACALAEYFSRKEKTLLVELGHETEEKYRPSIIHQESEGLFKMKIYPDQAIYEYLTLKIPKKLIDSLLAKSIIRALCSAMPGISDLTRLGKIWYHADEGFNKTSVIFEKIVVDLSSSGFAERFLSIAKVLQDAVKIGPLAKEARLIHEYFLDPNHALLHLVTVLEELVINETIELYRRLKSQSNIELGLLFINRSSFLTLSMLPSLSKNAAKKAPHIEAEISSLRSRIMEESIERRRLIDEHVDLLTIDIKEQFGTAAIGSIIEEIAVGFGE